MLGSLEGREAFLQRTARGIRDARVVVALVLADFLLDDRRRRGDRRRDRARRRIRLLSVVDGARLEVHYVIVTAPSQPARLFKCAVSETGFTPSSHQTPLTRSSRALRSSTGSMRP